MSVAQARCWSRGSEEKREVDARSDPQARDALDSTSQVATRRELRPASVIASTRCDRVGALWLASLLGGEAHVDVLARRGPSGVTLSTRRAGPLAVRVLTGERG